MRRSFLLIVTSAAVALSAQSAQNLVGDAGRGAKLFQDMKCSACHAVRGVGGRSGPALTQGSANAVAGAMWTHAIKMWDAMTKAGVRRPAMTQQQAADLVAHIAGKVQADQPGDVRRGEQAYKAKFCAGCHDEYSGASSFAKIGAQVSPYWMVAGMWQHGAGMLSRMVAKNNSWQTLSAQEVGDILAYLATRK
jgi:mono/diheme cytochrome c family protein